MVFFLLGVFSLGYLFTSLGELDLQHGWGYSVYAEFTDASGLKPGSAIEIAGVPIGQVTGINLDGARARVTMKLREGVAVQTDAIASIQTKGLLGERYITLLPGASEELIQPEGRLRETESPVDIPGMLAAYVNIQQEKKGAAPPPSSIKK